MRPGAATFGGRTMGQAVADITAEIQELYALDDVPWVIGYSGGKDSTAVLQLVWRALELLPVEQRHKTVHVISTDTLVENPIVASWVGGSLDRLNAAAKKLGMPVEAHKLTPQVEDTFWVSLIGKGYPAPRPKFRWCTERLKIKPSNTFIKRMVRVHGQAILVLGIRKAESQTRAATMAKHEKRRVRERLSPNGSLPNSLIYSPVEDWSNDDVWLYLMQVPNPWGHNNKDLLTMYQGASEDGECPLVVDTTTPSCGDSRFGCWTCTLVDKDKSMSAMISNDEQKDWMQPLLDIRNALDPRVDVIGRDGRQRNIRDDAADRDFRRMNGSVQLMGNDDNGALIHGPYTQQARERWLRMLLEAQAAVREIGPEHMRDFEIISIAELHEIRRLWVFDKHEIEDRLPAIYEACVGKPFMGRPLDEHLLLAADEMDILREVCGEDTLHFEMTRELLDVERRFRTMSRRAGLYDALEKAVKRGFYDDKDDAFARASRIRTAKQTLTLNDANENEESPVAVD